MDMDEIKISETTSLIGDRTGVNGSSDGTPPKSENHLGPINGVFVPCMLNIVGAIEFLRISWSVGQAGIGGVMLMFLLGETLVTITVLSLAALISNGEMRGGGAYYIISRAIGPELGTAIGILFYLSYSVGCTFYVVSFAEAIVGTFLVPYGIVPALIDERWANVAIGSGCLLIVLAIGLAGAKWFTKINVPLFVVQFGAILWGTFSIFASPNPCASNLPLFDDGLFLQTMGPNITSNVTNLNFTVCGALDGGGQFYGWSAANLAENAWSNYGTQNCGGVMCNWLIVFSIIFPAMTGIMEGANLSGDLRDPQKHIWKGTLAAIVASFFTYLLTIIAVGGGFSSLSLKQNYFTMQQASFGTQYIVWVGVAISTFSSALGALFGGSRILQAIARDEQMPYVHLLGTGYGRGDEPRRAVMATWVIAQAFLMMGNLDSIAGIITTFFLISYAMTNWSLVLVDISGTPNFRPRFKYYSTILSFFGGLANIVVMFLIDWIYSLAAIALLFVLLLLVAWRNSKRNTGQDWGDVRMALVYHQVRKYLLRMDPRESHGKLWRPSVLLLTHNLHGTLTRFVNYLKRGGVFIVGDVVVSDEIAGVEGAGDGGAQQQMIDQNDRWLTEIAEMDVKAFCQVVVAPSARFGCHALISVSGLGAMAPNTIVMPLYETPDEQAVDSVEEWCEVLADAHSMGKSVVVACNFTSDLNIKSLMEPARNEERTLDVIILPHVPCSTFQEFIDGPLPLMTLAHVLQRNNRVSLRVLRLINEAIDPVAERLQVVEIIKRQARFRVGSKGSQIEVFATQLPRDHSAMAYWRQVGDMLRGEFSSGHTSITLLPLPALPRASGQDPHEYLKMLKELTRHLPPTLLVIGAPNQNLMSTDI